MTEPTSGNPKSSLWQKCRSSGLSVILIVILIIAIAFLLLPKKVGAGARAKMKTVDAQIGAFGTAIDLFKLENGHFPNNLNDLVVKPSDASADWHPYLEKIPSDPWGTPYRYQIPGKHHPDSYDLTSAGMDGQFETKDDITNWKLSWQ